MSDKLGVGNKIYLKIHVTVNIRTNKEVLALDVTEMRKYRGDGRIMKKIVEDVFLKINHYKKKIIDLLWVMQ
jgi:hypothetical protein